MFKARRHCLRWARAAALCALAVPLIPVPALRAASESSSASEDYLEKALEAYFNHEYEESIDLFNKILVTDPKHDTAREGLKNALRARDDSIAKEERLDRPLIKSAKELLKRGDPLEAYERIRLVLTHAPEHPEALKIEKKIRAQAQKAHSKARYKSGDWFFSKGLLAYLDKDWLAAAVAWEQVTAFNPERVSLAAYIDRAKKNLEEQQQQDRLKLYQTVAWDNFKKGDYEAAATSWQELLNVDPGNLEAVEGIKQAEAGMRRAQARRTARQIEALSERAVEAFSDGDYELSLKLWREVQALNPSSRVAADYVRRVKEKIGPKKPPKGAAVEPEIALPPPNPDAEGVAKASAMLAEDRYADAAEYLETYLRDEPGDVNARGLLDSVRQKQARIAEDYYQKGLIAYSQGSRDEAVAEWQSALRVNPDFQKARISLIKAMSESRRGANK
jgi:tetratricopeptide (TPR) repeat protein